MQWAQPVTAGVSSRKCRLEALE